MRLVLALIPLAAYIGPVGAHNEAHLEENVAAESAAAPIQPTTLQRIVESPGSSPQVTLSMRSSQIGSEVNGLFADSTWAAGGKIGLILPEWRDTLSFGAAAYASFPMQAGKGADRTLLVAPDGDPLLAPGETYLNVRLQGLSLRLFRQLLDAPYLNAQDNRMIPNVFEAYTLAYRSRRFDVDAGHVTRMKARNSDHYVPMAEVAGVPGADSGVTAGSVRWRPTERVGATAAFVHHWDVSSTAYGSAAVHTDITHEIDLCLSAQFTTQRSVGKQMLGEFNIGGGGLKAAFSYRHAVFTLAWTTTNSYAGIRSPFGAKPSYTSLMLFEFDRAGERAWLGGAAYRLDDLGMPGWSVELNHVESNGALDSITGAKLDRRRETDLTVDYRPQAGGMKNLWLRLRYADGKDGDRALQQWRLSLNYDLGRN
jgi:hypothetical protein